VLFRSLVEVPREEYVMADQRELAYADVTLPLAHGEVITKPVVQARALEALLVGPEEDVLEIGTGSGYLTDCLSRLAREVVSIERHADLADAARSEEHTSELQSRENLVCRLLLE